LLILNKERNLALEKGSIKDIKYVGRAPSAATAMGFYTAHV
jgi:2-oxoglutarate dehydrogenase E1 component